MSHARENVMAKNIELFNLSAAGILAKLYEAFPNPIDLQPNLLEAEIAPVGFTEEQHFDFAHTIAHSGEWLAKEGFFSFRADYRTTEGPAFPYAVLTAKGLAILGATPDALSGKKTIGQAISDGLKEGKKEIVSGLIRELVVKGAGWAGKIGTILAAD